MEFITKVFFLICAINFANGDDSADSACDCMAKKLKQKGFLDNDFPHGETNPLVCFILQKVLEAFKNKIYERFEAKETINANCAKSKLMEKSFIDLMMKKEVIEMSTKLQPEKAKQLLENNRNDMKRILNEVAEECESDKTWAGAFDDVLGNTNSTLSVLEQNYCVLNYLLDNEIIEVENANRNPENIDISNINCDVIMNNYFTKLQNDVKEKYSTSSEDEGELECIQQKMNKKNLTTILAVNEIEKLDIPLDEKRRNKAKLEKLTQKYVKDIFSCVL
ncbi:hypothetical protein PVAND_005406 [Polypedilum vanderplanki]|uniref:Secreted protein n=1 Tax=Polypedilum vanderplanki TaxID=319348 RepID=A0A9J6C1Z3_POLVA|nr:hypothetical protein PVAND_005406 [Polypedilum vanderplanki]